MASTLLLTGSNGTLRGPAPITPILAPLLTKAAVRSIAQSGRSAPPVCRPNGAARLAKLIGEVPIGRLSLDIYAEQLRAENARLCPGQGVETRSPQRRQPCSSRLRGNAAQC